MDTTHPVGPCRGIAVSDAREVVDALLALLVGVLDCAVRSGAGEPAALVVRGRRLETADVALDFARARARILPRLVRLEADRAATDPGDSYLVAFAAAVAVARGPFTLARAPHVAATLEAVRALLAEARATSLPVAFAAASAVRS